MRAALSQLGTRAQLAPPPRPAVPMRVTRRRERVVQALCVIPARRSCRGGGGLRGDRSAAAAAEGFGRHSPRYARSPAPKSPPATEAGFAATGARRRGREKRIWAPQPSVREVSGAQIASPRRVVRAGRAL